MSLSFPLVTALDRKLKFFSSTVQWGVFWAPSLLIFVEVAFYLSKNRFVTLLSNEKLKAFNKYCSVTRLPVDTTIKRTFFSPCIRMPHFHVQSFLINKSVTLYFPTCLPLSGSYLPSVSSVSLQRRGHPFRKALLKLCPISTCLSSGRTACDGA